jgi:hypothetical protein
LLIRYFSKICSFLALLIAGSKTDVNGMCHYAICLDGSTPVGRGICVGFGVGECVHAADAIGNCMDPTFCGGPSENGFCPVTPTKTSMTYIV